MSCDVNKIEFRRCGQKNKNEFAFGFFFSASTMARQRAHSFAFHHYVYIAALLWNTIHNKNSAKRENAVKAISSDSLNFIISTHETASSLLNLFK